MVLHKTPSIEERQTAQFEREKNRLKWLTELNIRTILDIGANEGQFAEMIHRVLPEAMLISFEPIPACYKVLTNKFRGNKKFKSFNYALASQEGKIKMHINDFSPASSILSMEKLHYESFSYTKKSSIEEVSVKRLDDLMHQDEIERPLLIKIDVQGYECEVIQGGIETIKEADVIICEVSYESLYNGQPFFGDVYEMLISLGFEYHGNWDQLNHPVSGKSLQGDGIFIKRDSSNSES